MIRLKNIFLGLVLALGLASAGFAQDCKASGGPVTAAGRFGGSRSTPTTGFDNKALGCTKWILVHSSTGFSAETIALQSASDSSGVAGSWSNFAGTITDGTNPSTATTQASLTATGFYPWISVNLSSVTGSGSIYWVLYGWREGAAASSTAFTGALETGGNLEDALAALLAIQAAVEDTTPVTTKEQGATACVGTSALTTTPVTCVSAAAKLTYFHCTNLGTALAYVQVLNTASPTLGTTVPIQWFGIPAAATTGAGAGGRPETAYSAAITVAATTTPTGNTAPGTALACTFSYITN